MLARQSLRTASKAPVLGAAPTNARNMATLREIEMRLKSVKNIEKITKVRCALSPESYSDIHDWQIVDENDCLDKAGQGSACHEQRKAIRYCQLWWEYIMTCVTLHIPDPSTEVFENVGAEQEGNRKLFIVISSDKGLCGGIHSSVSKATRRAIANTESPVDSDSPIMIVGDKSKMQLARALPKNIQLTFNQIGRDIPTFADAAGVADLIVKSDVKYDSINIIYNKFVSSVAYESAMMVVQTEAALRESSKQFDFYIWLSLILL